MISRRALRKRRLAEAGLGLALAASAALTVNLWLGLVILPAVLWRASRHVGVPVMVYHSVSDDADWLPWADNIAIRPEVFAGHMAHLARSGWQVVPSQTMLDAQTGGPLPPRAVVLHFDDAYLDFLTDAAPVLGRLGLPATVFASSDFVDPSSGVRSAGIGYMNADELRAVDGDPLFEVACHGKDHARLQTGPATTPRKPSIWGKETAWLWSLCPGNKARWFEGAPPEARVVPENDSSLCARAWSPDHLESETERDTRVVQDLSAARRVLTDILGREVDFLCWPFDRCDAAALSNARAAGFAATTGGLADNRVGQGPQPLSRTHVNDHAAGGGPVWVEVVVFRAKLEVAAGNLLWWPIAAAASVLRKRRFAYLHGPKAYSDEAAA